MVEGLIIYITTVVKGVPYRCCTWVLPSGGNWCDTVLILRTVLLPPYTSPTFITLHIQKHVRVCMQGYRLIAKFYKQHVSNVHVNMNSNVGKLLHVIN